MLGSSFFHAAEFGADLVGEGMLDVLEDGQRLLPCLAGLGQFASVMTSISNVDESVRFMPAVAEFTGDAEGALVAGGGFAEVAEMVLGVAQAVPGSCLEAAVADFCVEGECLLAQRAGLLIVAEEAMGIANVVEHYRFCRLVPGRLV